MVLAVGSGDASAVRMLLDAGADPNAKDSMGMTAIMWAAGTYKLEIIHALLDAGADVNAKDNEGLTAAELTDRADIVRVLKAASAGSARRQR